MKHATKLLSLFTALLALVLPTGCNVDEMSTLAEISKPYVGEYKCVKLSIGGEDVLPAQKKTTLTLDPNGGFEFYSLGVGGEEFSYRGFYEMSREGDSITVWGKQKNSRRTFAYDDGTVEIVLLFGGKPLCAFFSIL